MARENGEKTTAAAGGESKSSCETVESREWYMAAYSPQGIPTSDHLKLRNVSITPSSLPAGHVLAQTLWLSVDPFLRSMMSGTVDGLYLPQLDLGQVVKTFGIAKVVKSGDENYREGDVFLNPFQPVAEYAVLPANPALLRKIDVTGQISPLDNLSCLGVAGFAAWLGIVLLGDPKPGTNVFISAAGGGVGMVAGQLAKLRGCTVIGSTGSDKKVQLIKDEFGYDDAFNYNKEADFDVALTKYFPNGIDLYLDNVGGTMLEAVLNHVNSHAKVILCGMMSQYNKGWKEREGVRNLLNIVGKEVTMKGFMELSYMNHFGDFSKEMQGHVVQGKIRSKHKIYHGIESFLESLESVFLSINDGKVVLQLV
ncbi:unnamed protein product [Linum tenue]|uniref:Enoyl reductase (ER) domain-containing protein n=4 Tax=Linum tenue TaxID=586396 RepID=A0AAV0NQF7_9ROSI|nr:unnamed protein product [Linum tenue]